MVGLTYKDDMKTFRKVAGNTVITNLSDYLSNYLLNLKKTTDEIEIAIGTDSQKIRRKTHAIYATVIVIYRKGKGGHIIYSKNKRTDVRDIRQKLMWEVLYSIAVADYLLNDDKILEAIIDLDLSIHLDLNGSIGTKKNNLSNNYIKESVGYVKGMNLNPRIKPDAVAASYAADMLCRK